MCFQEKFLRFLELHNDIYFVRVNALRVLLACFRTLLVITPCQESSSVIYSEVKIMIYKLCDSNGKSQIFKATWRSTIQGDHIQGKYRYLFIIPTFQMINFPHLDNFKILTHIIFDLQTVQSNNLTILYLKMKIFFVLASLIYFPCSVVLDMSK